MKSPKSKRKESNSASALPNSPLFSGDIVGSVWLPNIFFILAMLIFWLTLCPTVPGGDSGELISVAYNLGVAHPPGYPTYTLLAHLATYLPFGSVAFRVNFLSALIAAISGVLLCHIVSLWLRDRWLGLLAAGIFIFSPLAWRYAVVAEVFTLNNLFIIALLYATFKFCHEPIAKWAWLWAGTLGLACSHHHTIIFLAVPIFLILLQKHFRVLTQPKTFAVSVLVFLAGFIPYLYLPWAGAKKLMISWGTTQTWDGFWTHFLRKEYGTFQLATGDRDLANTFSNLSYFAGDTFYQFLWLGVPLVLYGAWVLFKRERHQLFGRVLLGSWIFYVLVFHVLANMDLSNRLFYDVQSRFWMLPNIIAAIFMVIGIKDLLLRLEQYQTEVKIGVVSVAIALQIGLHFNAEDHSKNTLFYELGKGTLDGLPQGAIAFMRGDVYVNSVRYLQSVEHYRTDVMSIPFDLLWWPWMKEIVSFNFPELKWPGQLYRYKRSSLGEFTLRDFFELNYSGRASFIGKLADYEMANLNERFGLVPVGFLNRIVPLGAPLDFQTFRRDVDAFSGFAPPGKDEIREKSWEAFIYYNYWDRELEKAKYMFSEAIKAGENVELITYGASILERVIREYPEAPPGAFRNLGVAYQILSRKDNRYYPMMLKVWRQYIDMNPTDDPQLEAIRQTVLSGSRVTIAQPLAPLPADVGLPVNKPAQ